MYISSHEDEDEDMKIVTDNFGQANETEDPQDIARELEFHKSNGNLEKAKMLGVALATDVVSSESQSSIGIDEREDANIILQRRILLAFTAIQGLEEFIPNEMISQIALAAFYDCLQETSPQIYSDINESVSFSFYFLCLRRGKDVNNKIAKTFAMLCGKQNQQVYTKLGEALYGYFLKLVTNRISKTSFTDL